MTIYENLIRRHLDDEGIRYTDIWSRAYSDRIEVTVYIERGDWKHDHLRLVRSVDRFNPVEHFETVTDEESGTTVLKATQKINITQAQFDALKKEAAALRNSFIQ